MDEREALNLLGRVSAGDDQMSRRDAGYVREVLAFAISTRFEAEQRLYHLDKALGRFSIEPQRVKGTPTHPTQREE